MHRLFVLLSIVIVTLPSSVREKRAQRNSCKKHCHVFCTACVRPGPKPVPQLDMGFFLRPNLILKYLVLNRTRKLCDTNYSNADC